MATGSLLPATPGGGLDAPPHDDTKRADTSVPTPESQLLYAPVGLDSTSIETTTSNSRRQLSPNHPLAKLQHDPRRDSGLATSSSTARGSHTTLETDIDSSSSTRNSPSLPNSNHEDAHHPSKLRKIRRWGIKYRPQKARDEELPPVPQLPFLTLTTKIPTSSIEDLTRPGHVDFTNRGSILIGGKKAKNDDNNKLGQPQNTGPNQKPIIQNISPSLAVPARILSAEDEIVSQEVRSKYDGGLNEQSREVLGSLCGRGRDGTLNQNHTSMLPAMPTTAGFPTEPEPSPDSTVADRVRNAPFRDDHELAGGIEDWANVSGGDVDRYGFIVQRRLPSRGLAVPSPRATSPEPAPLQRTSTALQLASEVPRRQRSRIGRTLSSKSPARSATGEKTSRPNSRLDRPPSSTNSYQGSLSTTQSKIRSATNRLPQNRGRRYIDEAGDMLTLPPRLADIAEDNDHSEVAEALKRQEWNREEKWRRMAKVTKSSRDGGGMVFEFDTSNPKLIERTWKGIPDRWRATAWHGFLTASAKKRQAVHSDDELISIFKQLLRQGSPDDFQIDLDVPRTINCHIMFRARYRGGQRLLFRVLHCVSIYFPKTGYVQGMAALAATLLCYFDEEMTFVMLVRLWQLRGLEQLYQAGFEGLMKALDEFETSWLAGGEVSTKLVPLSRLHYIVELADFD